jgi:hypothetical protein
VPDAGGSIALVGAYLGAFSKIAFFFLKQINGVGELLECPSATIKYPSPGQRLGFCFARRAFGNRERIVTF